MQPDEGQQSLSFELDTLFYPSYPSGCDPQIFHAQHQHLYKSLEMFDLTTQHAPPEATQRHKQDQNYHRNLVEMTQHGLNHLYNHTHRRQHAARIQNMVEKFSGNLQSVSIRPHQPKVSYWHNLLPFHYQNAQNEHHIWPLYQSAAKEEELLTGMDQLYKMHHQIPNFETYLLNYPQLAKQVMRMEELLNSEQTKVPPDHKHFLGIIAASTYGCRYLWNRAVANFQKSGGDMRWVEEGTSQAPNYLQDLAKYSSQIAYNVRQLMEEEIFVGGRRSTSGADNYYKLEALLILAYHHAMCCLQLICGLIPEESPHEKRLPCAPFFRPHGEMLERMQVGASKQEEAQMAKEFNCMYSWGEDDEEETSRRIQNLKSSSRTKRKNRSLQKTKSIESFHALQKDGTFLLGQAEQEEIEKKVNELECLKYIRKSYQHFVPFQTPSAPHLNLHTSNLSRETSINGSNGGSCSVIEEAEEWMLLVSEWDFSLKGLPTVESNIGSRWRNCLNNLVNSLKMIEKERSKSLQHYHDFFNNYMYEYVDYNHLLRSVTTAEKNYLKLITKTPFLFTEQTFLNMKSNLTKLGLDEVDFLLSAVGFKLQLGVTMLTYLYDKSTQEDSDDEDYYQEDNT